MGRLVGAEEAMSPDKIKAYRKKHYLDNKDKNSAYAKQYRKENLDKLKATDKKWRDENKAYLAEKKREDRAKNPEKHRAWASARQKKKYATDINFKIQTRIRAALHRALKRQLQKKKVSPIKHLGCTVSELVKYLESKFTEGMAWGNHGQYGWHIDHVRPLCSFDMSKESEQSLACHYTNLQPL